MIIQHHFQFVWTCVLVYKDIRKYTGIYEFKFIVILSKIGQGNPLNKQLILNCLIYSNCNSYCNSGQCTLNENNQYCADISTQTILDDPDYMQCVGANICNNNCNAVTNRVSECINKIRG